MFSTRSERRFYVVREVFKVAIEALFAFLMRYFTWYYYLRGLR